MHVWRNYLCYKCFPHYTENQSVCCQILGSIKIMHAHWGGIQSLSLDPEWEIFIAEIRQPRVKSGDWFLLADCCESKLELKVVITSSTSDTTYIQGQSPYSYLVWFKRKKKDKISQLHRFFPGKKNKNHAFKTAAVDFLLGEQWCRYIKHVKQISTYSQVNWKDV